MLLNVTDNCHTIESNGKNEYQLGQELCKSMTDINYIQTTEGKQSSVSY